MRSDSSGFIRGVLDPALLALEMLVIAAFVDRGVGLFIGFSVILALRILFSRNRRRDIITVLFGVMGGGGADALQASCGVYAYKNPDFFPLPHYMWIFWGQAFLVIRQILAAVDLRSRVRWSPFRWDQEVIRLSGTFLLSTLTIVLFHRTPWVAAVLCAGGLLLHFGSRAVASGDALTLAISMVLGPLGEGLMIEAGLYSFQVTSFWVLPIWHPLYWGVSLLLLRRLRGRLALVLD